MNKGDRTTFEIPNLDDELEDFSPRTPHKGNTIKREQIDEVASFPSREPNNEGQLNIKGPSKVLDRFRALRKSERYPYVELLDMMMDAYENKNT